MLTKVARGNKEKKKDVEVVGETSKFREEHFRAYKQAPRKKRTLREVERGKEAKSKNARRLFLKICEVERPDIGGGGPDHGTRQKPKK